MEIRKKIALGLIGLLLAACSTGDADNEFSSDLPVSANDVTADTAFEGVWSIDDTPLDQTFTIVYQTRKGKPLVMFPTFPYKPVLNRVIGGMEKTDVAGGATIGNTDNSLDMIVSGDYSIVPSATSPTLELSSVGYSSSANYFEQSNSKQGEDGLLLFGLVSARGDNLTVTLGLQSNETTFVVSEAAANCILMVKRVTVAETNGEKRTWVLNPAMRMTFVSTRKL